MFSGITTFVNNSTFSVGTGGTIHAPSTNTLNIGVNNTESIRIDSNSNLKVAGIVTATHFHGDGSNLTGISAGTSLSGSTNDTVCTVTGANAITGESNLTFNGQKLNIVASDGGTDVKFAVRNTNANGFGAYISGGGNNNQYILRLDDKDQNEYFRVSGIGHVGILNGNPQRRLHIGNSGNAESNIRLQGGADYFELRVKDSDDCFSFHKNIASGGSSEVLRLNANGSVSIANTRNYYGALNVEKTSSSSTAIDVKADGSGGSYAKAFTFGDHNTIQGSLSVLNSSDIFFRTDTNHSLTFGVNNTEKMRLNLHGFLKCMGDMTSHMSADGNNYHEMQADNPHIQILNMKHGSSNGYGIMMQFNHGKSTHWAFRVYNFASGSSNMFIRTDGDCENINNSYGGTSDIKLKENIVDAKSQWDDIKALRVRNFNYKSDESKTKMLGLVAQEAEQVCPSLVKEQPDLGEENEDLGTTTKFMKYSIVYMKAIKALQEAQERIEKLEQENIALRIRVTNLEDN
jgi:hypothetical protein